MASAISQPPETERESATEVRRDAQDKRSPHVDTAKVQAEDSTGDREIAEPLSPEERAAIAKQAKNKKSSQRWRAKKVAARKEQKLNAALMSKAEQGHSGSIPRQDSKAMQNGDLSHHALAIADQVRAAAEDANQARPSTSASGERFAFGQDLDDMVSQFEEMLVSATPKSHSEGTQEWKDAAEKMLYEFKKLGKAQEANLKHHLHEIGSFGMLPGGFTRYKGHIVHLCEEVMNVVHGGPATAKETAKRFLHLLGEEEMYWARNTGHLQMHEVLRAFATGQDHSVFLEIPAAFFGKQRMISLTQAAHLNQKVCARCHLLLVKIIQAQLPVVSGSNEGAVARGSEIISFAMSTLGAIVLAWAIGHSASFSTMRAIKPHPLNPHEEAIRQVLSGLQPDFRSRLWHHYDEFASRMPFLQERMQAAELDFDHCLENLDSFGVKSMLSTYQAVLKLMGCYRDLMEATFVMDARCGLPLSLLQLGILLALDFPELSLEEVTSLDVDPYMRIFHYFQKGFVPR